MYNIHQLQWDAEILDILNVPKEMLPEVKPSSCVYGQTDTRLFEHQIPICGAAGDQQCALFGQTCFAPGEAKNTYGTGGFLLMNTGEKPVASKNGLVTTIAWGVDGKVEYALEGSIFVAGAAVQWLRDQLGIIRTSAESEALATAVEDTNGCYMVPAFVGLGAPYWDQYARGAIVGLTRGTTAAHIARAALEGICYQVYDVLQAMENDRHARPREIRVDGGAIANNFLMQFQADICRCPVVRPRILETTALGAAYLAGLAVGYWKDVEDLKEQWNQEKTFRPQMEESLSQQLLHDWHRAVGRASAWEES